MLPARGQHPCQPTLQTHMAQFQPVQFLLHPVWRGRPLEDRARDDGRWGLALLQARALGLSSKTQTSLGVWCWTFAEGLLRPRPRLLPSRRPLAAANDTT